MPLTSEASPSIPRRAWLGRVDAWLAHVGAWLAHVGARLAHVGARLVACAGPLVLVAGGCGPQNAVVGAFPSLDARSQDANGQMDGRVLGWSTQFVGEEGLWQQTSPLPGATITFGVPSGAATDDAVVELRLPGKPGAGPDTNPGPDVATQIATRRFLQFGMFRTRVSFASCAATEEVASAVFAFFNDGSDANGNGIADNREMDFQVLCGTPTFIVLTCWSDFEKATPTTPERFIKRSRAVDMSTGDVYESVSDTGNAFAKATTAIDLAYPGFPDPNQFYEVGFDWQPSSLRFFIVNQGREMTLWTLADPNLIPQVPLQFMLNLWHPSEHWVPIRSSADYPARDAVLRADWASTLVQSRTERKMWR